MTSPTIEKRIFLSAAPGHIFAHLTEPELITRIFPFDAVEIDPRAGGRIVFTGSADGQPFTDTGTIDLIEAPRVFQYRYWSDNHGTDRSADNEVVLRYELAAAEGGTWLAVTHSRLPGPAYAEAMDAAWDMLLAGMQAQLGSGTS